MTETRWANRITRYGEAAPAELRRNPKNWRTHPRAQQDALAGVLSEVGWAQGVVVNERTGHLVDGHARVDLAVARKEPAVPVVYVDLSAEEEAKVLATLDPLGAMAGADPERLAALVRDVTTDDAALRSVVRDLAEANGIALEGDPPPEAPEPEIDRAEALRQKWGTAPGQRWEIGRHRVLCGDGTRAEDVARLLDGHPVHAVLTDPPFTFGLASTMAESQKAGGWADLMNSASWFAHWYRLCQGVLRGHGAMWTCCSWRTLPVVMRAAAEASWPIASVVVWDKDWIGPGGVRALRPAYELVALFLAGTFAIPDRGVPDVWRVPWSSQKPSGHPAEKPVPLFARCLEVSGPDVRGVYDPFLGSGTTLVAAEQGGRTAFGMEQEPKFVAVTLERLSQLGLEPRLVDA